MENKELLMRILDTYNDYAVCSGNLTEERVKFEHNGEVYEVFAEDMAEIKEIIERFERLEKYERVMIPPIRDVMDQLAEKEKQDKILSILKNKKVDIKLVLWAGQKVEAYNVKVREQKDYWWREELTQEEFDDIKEWLDNE